MLSNHTIIVGPCVYEGNGHAYFMAKSLKKICDDLELDLIFKMSFDKANRTSVDSYRGIGETSAERLQNTVHVFKYIRDVLGIKTITDIHEAWQAERIAPWVDVIQVPALLSRQTDLLTAAGKTEKTVALKRGQFMSPKDARHAVDKVLATGNKKVFVIDRGACFGYRDLVLDFRSIRDIKEMGIPLCYDITHPCQKPSAGDGVSSGDWRYAKIFGPAAAAAGVDAIFLETHNDPLNAKSDGPNSIPLDELEELLLDIKRVW